MTGGDQGRSTSPRMSEMIAESAVRGKLSKADRTLGAIH